MSKWVSLAVLRRMFAGVDASYASHSTATMGSVDGAVNEAGLSMQLKPAASRGSGQAGHTVSFARTSHLTPLHADLEPASASAAASDREQRGSMAPGSSGRASPRVDFNEADGPMGHQQGSYAVASGGHPSYSHSRLSMTRPSRTATTHELPSLPQRVTWRCLGWLHALVALLRSAMLRCLTCLRVITSVDGEAACRMPPRATSLPSSLHVDRNLRA